MQTKKLVYSISLISMFMLFLVLTACSEKPEKVVVKPLTKDQVMAQISQQLKKQTKLPAVQYHRKETLITGWTESKIEYYGDNEYYVMLKDSDGFDVQTYQVPGYQYERRIYDASDQREWKGSSFESPFSDVDLKIRTSSGNINDLKAITYFSILESAPDKVQMKETANTYELNLMSTDAKQNFEWMSDYLQNFADVIKAHRIEFQKYHTKMIIDKKTFAVQSIENEVFFTRKTIDLDNGIEGQKHLDIQKVIKYPAEKKLVVPQHVVTEGEKNDPMKATEPSQQK